MASVSELKDITSAIDMMLYHLRGDLNDRATWKHVVKELEKCEGVLDVTCDETNNTPEDRNNGCLTVEVVFKTSNAEIHFITRRLERSNNRLKHKVKPV